MRIPRLGVILSVIVIVVVGAAFLTNIVPYRQIVEQKASVEEARNTLTDLEAENMRLEEHLLALNTPEELERLAREKLGYVRPGEIAYVVVDPPEVPGQVQTEVEETPEEEPEGVVDGFWEFLTGEDLFS
ncbi:MAG: hypothetical protein GEU79_04405 [Acidimicrobiia bacterium]|nr:hypothetical protein [Acidimicrobiia bacterium]